jgi:hypothetical protein
MADKEVVKEEDRRFFYAADGETKYFINPPTAEDIRGADWQYSKTYTQCLIEGITTSAEMTDILTRRGIIGPEFEQRASELAQNLSNAITVLELSETNLEKQEASIKVAQARDELFQWNQRLNGPMNNTAEQMSDDARLEYLTSCMILDSEDNRVWGSYDVYLQEKSNSLATRARFEVMLYLQGLESDFLEQTPEALAMKEVQEDLIRQAEEEAKAAEAVAKEEEEEAKIENKTAPAKKKATKKKAPKKSKK